ncbi:MAG: hypothetical protein WC758_04050 [Candidatus Woesearchaeota archaeon]|jgi:hypothetical protein
MDKLSEFVSEQLKKGVKPQEMREHLIMNGWHKDEVDYTINSAIHKRIRHRILYAAIGLIVLGGLILSLFSVANNLFNETTPTPTPNIPPQDLTPVVSNSQGCLDKDTSLEKDECYKNLLRAGFKCDDLTEEIENVYCYRAFEELSLKGVEIIEEN